MSDREQAQAHGQLDRDFLDAQKLRLISIPEVTPTLAEEEHQG
jgi:hypothetical protein